jgi:hypothetical protein
MFISHKNRFVFVHIPKCAGTSVRAHLQNLNVSGDRYEEISMHPELGKIAEAHLPLSILRQYFPQEFAAVCDYQSFAILRDPMDRFPSSMSQHLDNFGSRSSAEVSKSELFQHVDAAIMGIESQKDGILPLELTHFQKQSGFVSEGGRRIVDNLYKIESMESFWRDLNEVLGLETETTPHAPILNEALVYRNPLIQNFALSIAPVLAKYLRPIISRNFALWAKEKMLVPRDDRWSELFNSSDIRNFVSSYYEEDMALYHAL